MPTLCSLLPRFQRDVHPVQRQGDACVYDLARIPIVTSSSYITTCSPPEEKMSRSTTRRSVSLLQAATIILHATVSNATFLFPHQVQNPRLFDLSSCRGDRSTTRVSLLPQQLGTFEPLPPLQQDDSSASRTLELYNFTTVIIPYDEAWSFQKKLMEPMLADNLQKIDGTIRSISTDGKSTRSIATPGALVMLQHAPVYTLGTASDESFITEDMDKIIKSGVDIVRIERGGEVTYHGPGQLTVYPIINLKRDFKADIHWYMRALEEVVITAFKFAGIPNAYREDDVTGVWVEGKKVAAFGVKVRRWICMHGLAVNVESSSIGSGTFERIVPCGLEGRSVGYVNEFLAADCRLSVSEFSVFLKQAFEQVFGTEIVDLCVDNTKTISLKHESYGQE